MKRLDSIVVLTVPNYNNSKVLEYWSNNVCRLINLILFNPAKVRLTISYLERVSQTWSIESDRYAATKMAPSESSTSLAALGILTFSIISSELKSNTFIVH